MYSITAFGSIGRDLLTDRSYQFTSIQLYQYGTNEDGNHRTSPVGGRFRSDAFDPCPHVICLAANLQYAIKAWTISDQYAELKERYDVQ